MIEITSKYFTILINNVAANTIRSQRFALHNFWLEERLIKVRSNWVDILGRNLVLFNKSWNFHQYFLEITRVLQ